MRNLKVCAGIVLFNPEINRLKQSVDAVISQVEKLVFVNNTPYDSDELKITYPEDNFVWINNNENLGIAAALNQLIEYAHNNGYEWVLTLDQDGVCSENLVPDLLSAARECENAAMISPRIIEHGTPWEDVHTAGTADNEHRETEEITFCITSGTLTNVKAILDTGGFDEKLFIDEVDRDMCIRLRSRGYRILRVNTAELQHEFGLEPVTRKIFFKEYKYRNYPPFRVYYQIRNMVYMVRKYGADYKPYPAWRLIRPFFTFTVKFIFEPQRFKRLSAFVRGYIAGLFMKVR